MHQLATLSDLHDQRRTAAEVAPDLVNRVFRSAHSLKGLAGMFGLEAIGELAHHLEDILDRLRLGRLALDSPAVDLLDGGVVLLASMLVGLGQQGEAQINDLLHAGAGGNILRSECGSLDG